MGDNNQMQIRLCIDEGPRKGEEFVVKGDITIGRSKGDLQLKDPKSSSLHAKITIDSNGLTYIEDLKSSNGTTLNGAKIQKAAVKPGDVIQIGRTKIRIETYTPEVVTLELEKGSWQQEVDLALSEALKVAEKNPGASSSGFGAFMPALVLEFKRGAQAGAENVLSFGPRKFGAAVAGGLILDSECPHVAFELFPTGIGACTLKSHSPLLRVNDMVVKTHKIEDGDVIEIGKTQLLIKTLKAP